MRFFLTTLFIVFLFSSCKITEQNVAGIYRLKSYSRTKLVLNTDKTFEFVKNFSRPGPLFFPDSTEFNFRTNGNWQWDPGGKVILNSFRGNNITSAKSALDSISFNTDITSFGFWDQYGDPVPIRFILFPKNRTKLHQGNLISFFAADFIGIDTLEFHFYGYTPFLWINYGMQKEVNNRHTITLYEQNRPGYFNQQTLIADHKKLFAPDKSFALHKSK